jgi:Protein of unknown function (DUF2778)
MAYVATTAGEFQSGHSVMVAGKIASIVAVLAVAFGAAAWTAGFNPVSLIQFPSISGTAASKPGNLSSFDDRFAPSAAAPSSGTSRLQSLSSEIEFKFRQAKNRLAQKLSTQDWRADLIDGSGPANSFNLASGANLAGSPKIDGLKPSIGGGVPLPRSRPVEAKVESPSVQSAYANAADVARAADRTLLQKLSDLLPTGGIKLASLEPDIGLSHDGPDLATLGYDNLTAVYDISAHAVYLPNGTRLEAHSGMGSLMDDPEHVSERMVGATPPAVYNLKPRERLFHGVEALRMIPEDSSATLGRSGLLTHSYMLGPNGDSNGCVSIKRYDSFIKAYKNGEINRLVVVPSLSGTASASQRTASQSSS